MKPIHMTGRESTWNKARTAALALTRLGFVLLGARCSTDTNLTNDPATPTFTKSMPQELVEVNDGTMNYANWQGSTLDMCFYNGTAPERSAVQTIVQAGWGGAGAVAFSWSGTCSNPPGTFQVPVFLKHAMFQTGSGARSGKGTRFVTTFRPAWAPSTAYSVGARVRQGGNSYVCVTAGISGTLGPASNLNDNSVVWAFQCGGGGVEDCIWNTVWTEDPSFGFKPLQVAVTVDTPDGGWDYNLVAHEFGHVLGFAHEFEGSSGFTGGCNPQGSSAMYTDADPLSIMQYPCAGAPIPQAPSLLDRLGVEIAYPFSTTRQILIGPGAAFETSAGLIVRSSSVFYTDWTQRGAADRVFGPSSILWKINGSPVLAAARLPISVGLIPSAKTVSLSFTDLFSRAESGSLFVPAAVGVDTNLHTAILMTTL